MQKQRNTYGKFCILRKDELSQLLVIASEEGAKRALEKCGTLSPYITRQEILKQVGRTDYENAIKNGQLTPIKNNGRNARISVLRSEFDRYVMNRYLK